MKKVLLLLVLFCFFPGLCLFAAVTGNYEFKFKITRTTDVGVTWVFTDLAGNQITSYNVDMTKTLNDPQIQLVVSTNKTEAYNITMTFGAMTAQSNPLSEFIGQYKARVSDIYDTPSVRNAVFGSAGSETTAVMFPGDVSNYAGTLISQAYPVAFDFSDYQDDYPVGNFSGTIVVEVTPVE